MEINIYDLINCWEIIVEKRIWKFSKIHVHIYILALLAMWWKHEIAVVDNKKAIGRRAGPNMEDVAVVHDKRTGVVQL